MLVDYTIFVISIEAMLLSKMWFNLDFFVKSYIHIPQWINEWYWLQCQTSALLLLYLSACVQNAASCILIQLLICVSRMKRRLLEVSIFCTEGLRYVSVHIIISTFRQVSLFVVNFANWCFTFCTCLKNWGRNSFIIKGLAWTNLLNHMAELDGFKYSASLVYIGFL